MDLRVSTKLSFSELCEATNGKLIHAESGDANGVCLDSRVVEKDDVFIAIKAQRDGHDYVESAFEGEAAIAIVEHESQSIKPQLKVDNTLHALHAMAKRARKNWGKNIVAISGSNGKTTTKEMCADLLGEESKVYRTPGSWNNHLGVPLSLLSLTKENEIAVLEMGMNHKGELKSLVEIASPNVVCLTNIGRAHIGHFGTIEKIAEAKFELLEEVDPGAILVINLDDERIKTKAQELKEKNPIQKQVGFSMNQACEVYLKSMKHDNGNMTSLRFMYGKNEFDCQTSLKGNHNVMNLLASVAISYACEVPWQTVQKNIPKVKLPQMRLERIEFKNEINVVMDCYNANPDSMKAALSFTSEENQQHKIAVLGDMKELGENSRQLHQEIGEYVARLSYSFLFVVGDSKEDFVQGALNAGMRKENVFQFENKENLAKALVSQTRENTLILVKGSRSSEMEDIVVALKNKWEEK